MNVLVTGGAGYIGSATVESLRQRGDNVVVLDNLSVGHPESLDPSVKIYQADLADLDVIGKIIDDHKIEAVVHFAAHASVPESVAKPEKYFQNNVLNTFNVLNLMVKKDVKYFILSSTAATFGEPQYNPIDEAHPQVPANPYGESKLMVEKILAAYDTAYGLKSVCLRYFNAAGGYPERGEDHTPETHLIPIALQVALGQREKIMMFGSDFPTPDGTCVRDYIHIEDLSQAHLLALDHLAKGGASERVNLGNGKGYSVKEVVEMTREVTGHPVPAELTGRRAGDPSTLVASSERARRVLGWEPKFGDLRSIVESAWEWHKTHPQGYATKK